MLREKYASVLTQVVKELLQTNGKHNDCKHWSVPLNILYYL